MSILQAKKNNTYFNQAKWEQQVAEIKSLSKDAKNIFESVESNAADNQFIFLQLSDSKQRIVNTGRVTPKFQGSSDKPNLIMLLDSGNNPFSKITYAFIRQE